MMSVINVGTVPATSSVRGEKGNSRSRIDALSASSDPMAAPA
jgi:hypothetical protein